MKRYIRMLHPSPQTGKVNTADYDDMDWTTTREPVSGSCDESGPSSRPIVPRLCVLDVCRSTAHLFVEPPPVGRKWPASLPHTSRRPWPLYTSVGISLCATPGGKLQLLVLSERERETRRKLLPKFKSKTESCLCSNHSECVICLVKKYPCELSSCQVD